MAGSNFRARAQEGTPRRKNALGSGSCVIECMEKDDLCLVVPPAERGVGIPTRPPA